MKVPVQARVASINTADLWEKEQGNICYFTGPHICPKNSFGTHFLKIVWLLSKVVHYKGDRVPLGT
jgi:hypothetical protein